MCLYGQEYFWNTCNIQYVIKGTFSICMSREGIRKMLHRMNFSYTKATYVLKKVNKEKQIQFQKQLDMIKKLIDENTVLLYQNECHFRGSQTVHATWFAKGKQKKIAVLGKRITASLFGTIDVITGKFICTKADTCNAETFQQFLNYVLKEYENKHVVLVLDNARYHHAKILKSFYEKITAI
ncbi:IS630 family transposase [Bacillus mycoides]|uniref:IS630 family transposase n=1 Tax=Bacillus mycoides TaxID=1405 RepID=UPI001914C7EC|nr:IS630 family transposase [Bacillus mycoides]MBK5490960.1 IS630 family transposase [Bacillus sp. TH17]